jgi:hypothetical protein
MVLPDQPDGPAAWRVGASARLSSYSKRYNGFTALLPNLASASGTCQRYGAGIHGHEITSDGSPAKGADRRMAYSRVFRLCSPEVQRRPLSSFLMSCYLITVCYQTGAGQYNPSAVRRWTDLGGFLIIYF